MKVLIVKLSSLGDVVHTFPALTDALRKVPGLELDWAVEEAFVPLVRLHPAVRNAIPVPMRRLRKAPLAAWRSGEAGAVLDALKADAYDVVIDAQGLVKSALIARAAKGKVHGFARGSAREGLASLAYAEGHHIPETEHMATRLRKLFALALGYSLDDLPMETGLTPHPPSPTDRPHMVLLHGTTWPTKTWTVRGWRELAMLAGKEDWRVVLFAQGAAEEARAAAIAKGLDHVQPLPPQKLETLIPIISSAAGVVSVDTGLGHLAAAFGVPTVGLYGPTSARLTGLFGPKVLDLSSLRTCAPCESQRCRIAPDTVEGPPCLADFSGRDAWRALTLVPRGHADAAEKA